MRSVVLVLAVSGPAFMLGGCGEEQGTDPRPHADVSDRGAAVHVVDESDADLVLQVSNQSFDDEEVRITVTVDDRTVVDDDFHVEDQHNWVTFHLAMPPGQHLVTATSDSGASLQESFRTPENGMRHAVIDYWDDDSDPTTFSWLFRRQPIVHA